MDTTNSKAGSATLAACALFLVCLAGAGCRGVGANGAGDRDQASGAASVLRSESAPTTRVRRGQVDALVTASGSVVAPRLTELGPEVSGRLSAVYFDVGDQVARGDIVLQLDRGPFETNLKRARAGLALAQAEAAQARQELERVQRLAEQEVAPPQQLDQQLTHLAVARARVEQELAAVRERRAGISYEPAVVSPYHAHVVERELPRRGRSSARVRSSSRSRSRRASPPNSTCPPRRRRRSRSATPPC